MSLATVAGMFLVVVPVALNVAFGLLAARFDYPVLQKAGADQGSRRSSRSSAVTDAGYRKGSQDGSFHWVAMAIFDACIGYRKNVKRDPALQTLSRDHQHGLAVALELKRASPETATGAREAFLDFWTREGQAHFRAEEELLLPAFAARGSADHEAVVSVLVEHVEIRWRASELAATDAGEARLRELGELLQGHIRHEERVLFPLIEDTLPREELERLAIALEAAEASR